MLQAWLNEPRVWKTGADNLVVVTDFETDFWNRTFYGFTHANGHFRYCDVQGDFSATVNVSADYSQLYDQAGLMLMSDADTWLKCGIEFTDGGLHFSTVATRGGYSDWSQQAVPHSAGTNLAIRLTRHAEALRVQYSLDGKAWTMARLAMLPMERHVKIGVMCCTPSREGLAVTFNAFKVADAIARDLHD